MAKKKLLIENDYEFFLFGISCPEKSYRLCFALNNKLNITFSKSKDMEVWISSKDQKFLQGTPSDTSSGQEKNQKIQSMFPVFSFCDEEMFTDYRIIVNRANNRFLIPEFKEADYLLMVQGGMPQTEKNNILKKIREVAFVQAAFEIDPKKIKSKENFVF